MELEKADIPMSITIVILMVMSKWITRPRALPVKKSPGQTKADGVF